VISAIREALSGGLLSVSQNVDHGRLFSDIDSFVKLSKGNTSVTEVSFRPVNIKGDDTLHIGKDGKRSSQSQVA
jgi:hypothetical protein